MHANKIPLFGSDVLSHLTVTHLSGIFKAIIPYYTGYIAPANLL